jgi:tryptophan synthase alpha chain
MNRIDQLFKDRTPGSGPTLIPFLTAGDPDLETTHALLDSLSKCAGVGLVELGIPYSDPIADGPVITDSYTRALRRGVNWPDILEMIRKWHAELPVSSQRTAVGLVIMVSFAIVHRRRVDVFLDQAAAAGVDGLIIPDLPLEEAEGPEGVLAKADARGLRLIQLVTPTTPRERALRIARSSSGFLYYVTIAGITGERRAISAEVAENVAWLRTRTELPICIGFGIATTEQVRQLAPVADGLIVGSAIVRRIAACAERGLTRAGLVGDVADFVASLAGAATEK